MLSLSSHIEIQPTLRSEVGRKRELLGIVLLDRVLLGVVLLGVVLLGVVLLGVVLLGVVLLGVRVILPGTGRAVRVESS